MNPGTYTLAGEAVVMPSGEIYFQRLTLKPKQPKQPRTLQQIWKGENYSLFLSELQRNGFLNDGKLNLNASKVRGLIQYLESEGFIQPVNNWVEVFSILKNTFRLKFKRARSLQAIKETNEHFSAEYWRNVFSLLRFDTNEIFERDTSGIKTELCETKL
jgi:hypothetical protein